MEKVRDCQLFMTTKDEKMFCEALRQFDSNICFLDTKPSFDSDIDKRLVFDVTELNSEFFSIVNLGLISIKNATDITISISLGGHKCNSCVHSPM